MNAFRFARWMAERQRATRGPLPAPATQIVLYNILSANESTSHEAVLTFFLTLVAIPKEHEILPVEGFNLRMNLGEVISPLRSFCILQGPVQMFDMLYFGDYPLMATSGFEPSCIALRVMLITCNGACK